MPLARDEEDQQADRRSPKRGFGRGLTVFMAVVLLLCAGALTFFSNHPTTWHPLSGNNKEVVHAKLTKVRPPCSTADNEDLLVIVKTGSSVMYERALVHLQTTLECIPHRLLVSDVDADVGPFHFVDVIKELDEWTLQRKEFEAYRRLKEAQQNNDDHDFKSVGETLGWDLDKHKFIPMVYRAWQERIVEKTKWFVFIEADTLVDWANLRTLLDNSTSSEPLYYGAPVFIDGFAFGHGGSGVVLSHQAMQQSVGKAPKEWLSKWGPKAIEECCGDFLLAQALRSYDVNLTGANPIFQGSPPNLAPILPELWCRPVVTMHHVSQRQVAAYWGAQRAYTGNHTSLLWNDVFDTFVEPNLRPYRLDWDNLSGDWTFSKEKLNDDAEALEVAAVASPGGCERMCLKERECLQWSHHGLMCMMDRKVRAGRPSPKRMPTQPDDKWISGWMLDRIKAVKFEATAKCQREGVSWTFT